jgi:hypothetical protein
MVSITPRLLYAAKGPEYPFASRLGIPQIRSGRFGEEKNVFPLPEMEPQIEQHLAWSLTYVIPELKGK